MMAVVNSLPVKEESTDLLRVLDELGKGRSLEEDPNPEALCYRTFTELLSALDLTRP